LRQRLAAAPMYQQKALPVCWASKVAALGVSRASNANSLHYARLNGSRPQLAKSVPVSSLRSDIIAAAVSLSAIIGGAALAFVSSLR